MGVSERPLSGLYSQPSHLSRQAGCSVSHVMVAVEEIGTLVRVDGLPERQDRSILSTASRVSSFSTVTICETVH